MKKTPNNLKDCHLHHLHVLDYTINIGSLLNCFFLVVLKSIIGTSFSWIHSLLCWETTKDCYSIFKGMLNPFMFIEVTGDSNCISWQQTCRNEPQPSGIWETIHVFLITGGHFRLNNCTGCSLYHYHLYNKLAFIEIKPFVFGVVTQQWPLKWPDFEKFTIQGCCTVDSNKRCHNGSTDSRWYKPRPTNVFTYKEFIL